MIRNVRSKSSCLQKGREDMQMAIPPIELRKALHFLGWRGTPVDDQTLEQIQRMSEIVRTEITAHVITGRFALDAKKRLIDTVFAPQGADVCELLATCDEAILLAATLGAKSERLLLRQQASSGADALIMDAVLSAAIEAVCDEKEAEIRRQATLEGYYLTDRFSPGYGDMPLLQTREICAVLHADRSIGLTVSHSGIMIPRKSVTAIMGLSRQPQKHRPSPCAVCNMRKTCALRGKN